MKIVIKEDELSVTPELLLKQAGYAYKRNRSGQDNFVRRLGAGNYPRFHAYIKRQGEKIIINLHLDQKQPSYQGTRAHSGEHGGEVVEEEGERIRRLISHST